MHLQHATSAAQDALDALVRKYPPRPLTITSTEATTDPLPDSNAIMDTTLPDAPPPLPQRRRTNGRLWRGRPRRRRGGTRRPTTNGQRKPATNPRQQRLVDGERTPTNHERPTPPRRRLGQKSSKVEASTSRLYWGMAILDLQHHRRRKGERGEAVQRAGWAGRKE
jgi:hypothetical protein